MTNAEREKELDMAVLAILCAHGTRTAVEARLKIYPETARRSVARLIAAGRVEIVQPRRGPHPVIYKVIK